MKYPTREKVQQVREMYPTGCRVELVEMGPDPYSKLQPGDQGTVKCVDDIGTVFVSWDCGSGLGMVYGVDTIRRVDKKSDAIPSTPRDSVPQTETGTTTRRDCT